MNSGRAIAMAIAAGLFLNGAAVASPDKSGSYDLYRDGQRVGSERYTWDDTGEGQAVLRGECVLEVNGVSTSLRPSLTLDDALMPVSFDLDRQQGGESIAVSTVFDGKRADHVIRENGMETKKRLKINPADLVVQANVLSLFLPLVEKYDFEKGGEQDLTVFDVDRKESYTAHCRVRGLGTVENGNGSFRARRLTIDLYDTTVDILVDKLGRVPQISIPMMKMEARLLGYDGADKAELRP